MACSAARISPAPSGAWPRAAVAIELFERVAGIVAYTGVILAQSVDGFGGSRWLFRAENGADPSFFPIDSGTRSA
jgi:hypothetical protein